MSSFFKPREAIDKSKHNLPHWHQETTWVFATWRLKDALPQSKLKDLELRKKHWIKHHPKPWDHHIESSFHELFSDKIEQWMDLGMGSWVLRDTQNAALLARTLTHFEQTRYVIGNFVIMPNHVHVLFLPHPTYKIPTIIKSWKGFSARLINQRMNREGALWQNDYWDRLIRNSTHLQKTAQYIKNNPYKANLKPNEFYYFENNTALKRE